MTAPSYTTDLATINLCDSAGAFTEPTGFADGAVTYPEADYFIQNAAGATYGCASKSMGAGTSASSGLVYNYTTGITITAPSAVWMWIYFGAPNALATQSSGGLRLFAGSGASVFKQYYVKGSDTYTYGGWLCIPFHPSIETGAATIAVNSTNRTFTRSAGDFSANGFRAGQTIVTTGFTNAGNNTTKIIESVTTTVITVTSGTGLVTESPGGGDEWIRACDLLLGTPTTTAQYFGAAAVLSGTTAVSKGNPLGLDAMRYGRGEARIAYGSTADGYATFSGFAAANDAVATRWGLIQAIDGGYLAQGLVIFGYANACDFRDSNKSILIANTQKVIPGFNAFEVRQSGSRVDLTAISFLQIGGTTATAKAVWTTTDNADINIDGCTFTDFSTFSFLSSSTVLNTVFRRCDAVDVGGGTFTGCTWDNASGTTAVSADSPAEAALISDSTFTSDGTGYAITIGGTADNMTLTNVDFSNYAASDGTSGNEAIYFNIDSGTMNLTITGGSEPSIRTAGVVVTKILSSRTVGVYTKTADGSVIGEANVYLAASGVTGPFPVNESVTIVNSGTTATVTHTGHGLASNDYVCIKGASLDANNGVFMITRSSDDVYTYTMGSTPGSSPTGSITSTFVFMKGLSNITTGYLSMSRSIPGTQPVTGWARKSSGSPYYKTGPITGSVASDANTYFTAVLTSDE